MAAMTHQHKPKLEKAGYRRIMTVLLMFVFIDGMMFIAAGTLRWPLGWAYVSVTLLSIFTLGLYAAIKNPELINERGRRAQNTKPWDKWFAAVYAPVMLLTPIVAGVDFRFDWTAVPLWLIVVAYVALLPALALPYWSMMANNYLTVTVRIQQERGHQVVSSGPYRFVRHPMYLGAMLTHLFTPLALSSWWALLPGGIAAAAMLIRTALEDKTLQAELDGYSAYANRVRYRLLPGVW